jgi:hypothetical protein
MKLSIKCMEAVYAAMVCVISFRDRKNADPENIKYAQNP